MCTVYRLASIAGLIVATSLAAGCLVTTEGTTTASGTVTYESAPQDAAWEYYPETDVYYSSNRSVYYYHDTSGRWIYARERPAHIHGALGNRVSVTYVGARPYDHYSEHRRGHDNDRHDNDRHDNDRRDNDRRDNDRRGDDRRGDGRH